jgi:AraC family transcriptional regulator
LNEPATTPDGRDSRWSATPRWYLWDGGFLALARAAGIVPPHAHHAIQIVITIEGEVGIRGKRGDWRMGPGIVVREDVVHSYNGNNALGGMVFVEPESVEGIWLRTSLRDDISIVPSTRLAGCSEELRRFFNGPLSSADIGVLIRGCVQALCTGLPPRRRLDERVTRVLASIRSSDELRMSIEEAAALAYLSPSRFAHLFKQQVGLPFRRYILWRKLIRAVLAVGRERTLAAAAHAADFADAAHLTRTFYQMFGIPPSVMMRGEFFEIPSPFELSATPETRG